MSAPTLQEQAAVQVEPTAATRVCTAPAPMSEFHQQAKRLQELVERADALRDPSFRSLVQDTLQSVLSFYGEGLARVLHLVHEAEAHERNVFDSLIHDPGVSGLLLIHGLHPLDLETRAREALDKVRPYMESHGGSVELISLKGGIARLRLRGTCKSCPSSSVTLELAVRRALEEACPDLAGFQVE